MGKTPSPLKIVVARELWDNSIWAELTAQGHTVTVDEGEYDIAFGPRCWRMLPRLTKYITLALKEARAAKAKRPKRAAEK